MRHKAILDKEIHDGNKVNSRHEISEFYSDLTSLTLKNSYNKEKILFFYRSFCFTNLELCNSKL